MAERQATPVGVDAPEVGVGSGGDEDEEGRVVDNGRQALGDQPARGRRSMRVRAQALGDQGPEVFMRCSLTRRPRVGMTSPVVDSLSPPGNDPGDSDVEGATMRRRVYVAVAAGVGLLVPSAALAAQRTGADPMVRPVADGWASTPIWTVGESITGYAPPGIPDGMSAYRARGGGVMSVFVNHELRPGQGYPYRLANGTVLTGARISRFDIQTNTLKVIDAELAYDRIYDVDGEEVADASQVGGGLGRLCSGRGVGAGEYGFVDDIHLTGEEGDDGVLYALDIASNELWAVPDAGLLAWENVAPVDTGTETHTALLIGDDREGAPLWLYVGEKQPGGSFLERNGLADGTLYAWVADANSPAGTFDSPAEFAGNGAQAAGTWVAVDVRDGVGALRATEVLDADAAGQGAFEFSRPEDLHENPANGQQLVLASTGRQTWDGASDVYGTTYLVDVAFGAGTPTGADLTILYDGEDALASDGIDAMLRSPDNVTWATDGMIYAQEDKAVDTALWGSAEASIWQLDPGTPGAAVRIAQVDRAAVPEGQSDSEGAAPAVGTWETSGIVDVSHLVKGDDLALLYNAQAHSVGGGPIDDLDLVQGGQVALLTFGG